LGGWDFAVGVGDDAIGGGDRGVEVDFLLVGMPVNPGVGSLPENATDWPATGRAADSPPVAWRKSVDIPGQADGVDVRVSFGDGGEGATEQPVLEETAGGFVGNFGGKATAKTEDCDGEECED
jgi:hypothetical protein